MLWDIIRDFFVQYIFGGVTSTGNEFGGFLGYLYNNELATLVSSNTSQAMVPINLYLWDDDFPINFMSLGDWLSTTATIIILCLVILFFIKLTIWFFKQGAGLFKW